MYSKYQIAKAQNVSLLDYIESRGYELIYSNSDVRLKEHDSLVISNNKWKWFSRNVGGGTLDFLIEYDGKSFKEAMQILLGEKGIDEKKPQYKEHIQKQKEIKEISELPEKNNNYRRMYAYLNKTRCIDLVNERYIQRINNDNVIIKNNQKIPMSRSRIQYVQQKLIEALR